MVQIIKLHEEKQLASARFRYFLEHVLGQRTFVLVVTAPWCGHCIHFKPEFEKAVKKLATPTKKATNAKSNKRQKQKGGGEDMYILDMNDKVSSHLRENHSDHVLGRLVREQVAGFPTCVGISGINGKNEMAIHHYDGDRKEAAINEWLKKIAST